MNRVIKQLAEQAGFQYIKDSGIGWAGNYNASLPKFAELIVRECVGEFVRKLPVSVNVSNRARHVMNHFGVEE